MNVIAIVIAGNVNFAVTTVSGYMVNVNLTARTVIVGRYETFKGGRKMKEYKAIGKAHVEILVKEINEKYAPEGWRLVNYANDKFGYGAILEREVSNEKAKD